MIEIAQWSGPPLFRNRTLKYAKPAVEPAQNFAKICINDAGICCKIFTISTHSAANFAAFLRRFRFETRKTSAQLQCTSAPCCASKKPCVQRCDCANFSPENARIRCKFSARSTRNAPTIRPVSLRKHGDVSELLRQFPGACNAENARSQRSNMRNILPKFASMGE